MNSNHSLDPLPHSASEMTQDLAKTNLHDRYQILGLLGEGGSGKTYRALDIQQQTEVAIKVLSLRNMKDWKTLELFEREAKILAQLNHRAIPKYIDFFRTEIANEETFCLVQAIAPGRSLNDWVTSGHVFDESDLQHIAKQVLEILIYLQTFTPPIIHRDIKPQNLLFNGTGTIYLVDFGAVRDTYHLTITGGSTIVGTYGYMAPEQFRGQAVLATDLYGLGATLLYLATGQDPADLPLQEMKIDFRQRVNLSPDFANWLDVLLEPIPEDRYRTASLALDYLQNKAGLKFPRPPQPLSVVSWQAETITIVIPPVGLSTITSKRTLTLIGSLSLLWIFCYWLVTSTSFNFWSLISYPILLILPLCLLPALWNYIGGTTSRQEIIINNQTAICTIQIAENSIEEYIMPLSHLAVYDRGSGIQFQGMRQRPNPPYKLVRGTYHFGQYLDRAEQLWIGAEIQEHLRLSNSVSQN
jgi:eukaryotic-like serine/threonine-protein kinase